MSIKATVPQRFIPSSLPAAVLGLASMVNERCLPENLDS
jgi:hypothetical protein